MKKTSLSVALAALLGIAALAPTAASAADGTMTFLGTIQAVTCTITGNGSTNGDFTVNLPTLGTSALPSGANGGQTNFAITLTGADCADGKTASVMIEGAETPLLNAGSGTLKNSGTSNVEVALVNADNNQKIHLGTGTNMPTAVIAGNSATLHFAARYEANNGDATTGDVNTSAVYSVTYN